MLLLNKEKHRRYSGKSCNGFVRLDCDKRLLKLNQEMEFLAKTFILVSNWADVNRQQWTGLWVTTNWTTTNGESY